MGKKKRPDEDHSNYSIEALTGHLSEGGTLLGWCRERSYRYIKLAEWIQAGEGRAEALQTAISLRKEMITDRLLSALLQDSFFDTRKLVDKDGDVLPLAKWPIPPNLEVNSKTKEVVLKTRSKATARNQLIKLLGLDVKKVEHSGNMTLESLVADKD